MGGVNIFIHDIVEYIDVKGVSCPFNKRNKDVIKINLEYIDVEGASCLRSKGIKCHYTVYCKLY